MYKKQLSIPPELKTSTLIFQHQEDCFSSEQDTGQYENLKFENKMKDTHV